MQKARRALAETAGRFLFIGISVQIVLGICWMIRSFGIFPEFGDSYLWLRAADTFVCDDYMGIGYPLFLMLAKGIEAVSSIPYTFFVYTVQIVFAFYSGVVFLRSFGGTAKKWFSVWGSLGLLTYPFAMQCHLAVLPNSVGYSCLLMELAVLIRLLREDGAEEKLPIKRLFVVGIWWMLSALFVVENRYLGLVPLVVVWILHLIRIRQPGRQRVGRELLLLAAMAGILFALVPLWQTQGSYGRAENTLSAAMMRRFTWTHMREEEEYDAYPEELREQMTWKEFKAAGYYAGTMESGIQKTIEDKMGSEDAQKLFRKYAIYGLKTYSSDNIHQIVWDMAGYVMPSILLQLFLDGRGYDTFSGRNVDIMMTGDLKLTNVLLKYSSWWFLVGIAAVFLAVVCRKAGRKDAKICSWRILLLCAVSALCMVLWYTMQDAGCWDYKNGLLPGILWLVGMILSVGKEEP